MKQNDKQHPPQMTKPKNTEPFQQHRHENTHTQTQKNTNIMKTHTQNTTK